LPRARTGWSLELVEEFTILKVGSAVGSMESWDLVLVVVAGYLASSALVRLMIWRRDQALDDFRLQMAKEKRRKEAQKKKRPREAA